jgi:hypothetical protein
MKRLVRYVLSLGIASVAVMGAALGCDPKPGSPCTEKQGRCADKTSMIICNGEKWVLEPCRGPRGCYSELGAQSCDHDVVVAGDACVGRDEDQSGCSEDGKTYLECDGSTFVPVSACRGPGGCYRREGSTGRTCDGNTFEVGDRCRASSAERNYRCSVDRKAKLRCIDGKAAMDEPCLGPKGCFIENDALMCDNSVGKVGDPCSGDGRMACTNASGIESVTCKDGRWGAGPPCRGPIGCFVGDNLRVVCDRSRGEVGDPCDGGAACSVDEKAILSCEGGKLVKVKDCRNGCELDGATNKIRCK